MRHLILILLSLFAIPSFSSIYMQKDNDGDVTYTDIPATNSQPVSLSPGNSVPSTLAPAAAAPAPTTSTSTTTTTTVAAEEEKVDMSYNAFTITSPTNNETIQNQPIITVKIAIDPQLRQGDTIQVYLDNKPWGTPVANTNIDLENVERGEHTLSAKLLDSSQNMLKQAETIKIFVHRASTNFKAAFSSQPRLAELILR